MGLSVVIGLLLWMVLETVILILANTEYTLGKYDRGEGNIATLSEYYASKSLTFASLTFAGLTFILAQRSNTEVDSIFDTLFLFTFGFSLFILSYKLDVFAAIRRIYFSIQQRLFNFGILSLISGLVIYFYDVSTLLFIPILMVSLLVFFMHIIEYIQDFQDYSDGNGSEQSKITDFY